MNTVKLDLAIIIVFAFVIIVLVSSLVEDPLEQFVWLTGYGLLSMLWLVFRVRRVVQTCQQQNARDQHET